MVLYLDGGSDSDAAFQDPGSPVRGSQWPHPIQKLYFLVSLAVQKGCLHRSTRKRDIDDPHLHPTTAAEQCKGC